MLLSNASHQELACVGEFQTIHKTILKERKTEEIPSYLTARIFMIHGYGDLSKATSVKWLKTVTNTWSETWSIISIISEFKEKSCSCSSRALSCDIMNKGCGLFNWQSVEIHHWGRLSHTNSREKGWVKCTVLLRGLNEKTEKIRSRSRFLNVVPATAFDSFFFKLSGKQAFRLL